MQRLLLLAVAVVATTLAQDVLLPPVSGAVGPDVVLLYFQGADINASQYIPTVQAIQNASVAHFRLWVGIPEFWLQVPEPLVFGPGLDRVFYSLVSMGMPANITKFGGGHSLGGVMLRDFIAGNKTFFAAEILMGSFIARHDNATFTTPTLTIGGELDGLCRVFRIAEAYYWQTLQNNQRDPNPWFNFPVTIVHGMSHMQFASGVPPANVKENDLQPEISYDLAHSEVGRLTFEFMLAQYTGKASSFLNQSQVSSLALILPVLKGYQLEGNYQLLPPCNCDNPTYNSDNINYEPCQPKPGCQTGSPWGEYIQQEIGGLNTIRYNVTSAFHPVWQTTPTNLPYIFQNCTSPTEDCLLTITTVNQNEYTEDPLDTGFFPQSALEIRAKMMSRQAVWIHAGIVNASFNETDGGNLCADMNAIALQWALENAPARTVNRYRSQGEKMVFGPDIEEIGGPWWIWTPLQYNETTNGTYLVTSPAAKFPDPFWLPISCCFHYCKLLSPARALEWLYIDSNRLHHSLKGK